MEQRVYIVRPAIFTPAILSAICVVAAFERSWWCLAALPFIWLGSICAQPNLNLANGCFAYVAMLAGAVVAAFLPALGFSIFVGTFSSYCVSAVEKRLRMRPAQGG